MLKILTTATEEELAVILSALQKIEEDNISKNQVLSGWSFCSKANRGHSLNWENKKTNSFWALENKNN